MFDRTIRNSIRGALFGVAALTASMGWASIGWAQETEPTTSSPNSATTPSPAETAPSNSTSGTDSNTASSAQAVTVDDQKIEKFADAYVAVQKIQTEAAGELDKSANDPAKQQEATAAVESQMIAAVERTGLKLEEFNGIVQTMTADADLRARVVAKIRERMGG
jgi:cytoskeletal protein RodZ